MAKRKTNNTFTGKKWFIIIPFILVGGASVTYIWNKLAKINHAKFVRYPAFGIDIPDSYEIHGIDVSKYQSYIDWASVKEMKVDNIRIGFTFIKATEGMGNTDRYFKRNWKKAKESGVTRGAYHFFLATKSEKLQPKTFTRSVPLDPGDPPPVLDIEQTHGVNPARMRK